MEWWLSTPHAAGTTVTTAAAAAMQPYRPHTGRNGMRLTYHESTQEAADGDDATTPDQQLSDDAMHMPQMPMPICLANCVPLPAMLYVLPSVWEPVTLVPLVPPALAAQVTQWRRERRDTLAARRLIRATRMFINGYDDYDDSSE